MNPRVNELLSQLSENEYQRLAPNLQLVSLVAGDELYSPGDLIEKIYFPVTASVAICIVLGNGQSIDTVVIGSDGMVGLRGMDDGTSAHRFHVASSGLAYQIHRKMLIKESQHGSGVYRMCFQAGVQVIRKMSMEVACSHFHTAEQRIAKWILNRHDYEKSDVIRATQQTIADSLGVRREVVSNTTRKLRGLSYGRSTITLEDRSALEQFTCECYFAQSQIHPHQMPLPLFTEA